MITCFVIEIEWLYGWITCITCLNSTAVLMLITQQICLFGQIQIRLILLGIHFLRPIILVQYLRVDSNRGPLVLEATLPQPLHHILFIEKINFFYFQFSVSQFTWQIWQTNNSIKRNKPNRIMNNVLMLCLGPKKSLSSLRLELTA